jgi:pyruvate dehydrogenase E2 component (dihydrolipoamide acetyltransferase)
MTITILMPALSPTMTEGNLVKWLKKEGDPIKAGDVVAEIETDKATMEVEAVDEGILGRILIPAGTQKVAVNVPIGVILEEGEDASALDAKTSPDLATAMAQQPEKTLVVSSPDDNSSVLPKRVEPVPQSLDKRVFASPLARRVAKDNKIDLQALSGSGPHGRIIRADVENAAKKLPVPESLSLPPVTATPSIKDDLVYTDKPVGTMRKVIAQRLLESKQRIPHFYLTIDCNLDALITLRKQLNDGQETDRLSINDFIIRATALALIKVPDANVSWQETTLRYYKTADIAVAVAVDNGLITPIVKAAHEKTLHQISREMKTLAEKARSGKLSPSEFQGGTFTVSNLGMYGIKNFNAIINPPQACILAVGAGEPRPVVFNNELKIVTQMTCTLSVDHRAVDGSIGATFLTTFKNYMENPFKLLL